MSSSLFAVLLLDRVPLGLSNVGGLAFAWLQDAGGFAALGLFVYLLIAMLAPADQPASGKLRMPVTKWMTLMAALSLITYALLLAAMILGKGAVPESELPPKLQVGEAVKYTPPKFQPYAQPCLLALGGLFAVLGICQPFVRDLFKLRFRRIFALIKVCFLEAMRNRIFWIFLLYMLVFLFPANWFSSIKPEDELRTPIAVFSVWMNLLLTIPFVILAAFAIPTDVKNNTLYTIVTKPVERFEIVLGRFLGYGSLMTVALLAMVAMSVIYIYTSKFDDKAKEESFRSRVTVRGTLDFKAFSANFKATNVGREFDYRQYIGGSEGTRARAIWNFYSIPSNLTRDDRGGYVPCEYTFDIFRLTKGEENRGVMVDIRVVTWQNGQKPSPNQGEGRWLWDEPKAPADYEMKRRAINVEDAQADSPAIEKLHALQDEYKYYSYRDYEAESKAVTRTVKKQLKDITPESKDWKYINDLAKRYGFYEKQEVEVFDFRPGSIPVPTGLFEKGREGDAKSADGKDLPRVSVYVKCVSPGQLLGMAEADLYLIEGDRSFAENYFKSAFGLWCRLMIVIGLAVTFSTYLAAMISLIVTLFLYLTGYFAEHVQDVGAKTSVGGGPFEGMVRTVRGEPPTVPLDGAGSSSVFTWGDEAYAWIFRRFFNLIPDLDAFAWTEFLAEGYNVSIEYLIVNFLLLVGYLLPWGVLAYYLIRNREVAA